MMERLKNKKFVIILLVVVLSLTVFALGYFYTYGKGELSVSSTPEGLEFSMEGKYYKTPILIKDLKPGKYNLYAHNASFEDYETVVIIKRYQKQEIELEAKLKPVEEALLDEERKWLEYFQSQSKVTNEELSQIKVKYPIVEFLPYFVGDVMLDYKLVGDKFSLYVMALPNKTYKKSSYLSLINTFLREHGVNPADYIIEWK